jgi:cytochrome c-type biogenesis protein CcmH/NrfG
MLSPSSPPSLSPSPAAPPASHEDIAPGPDPVRPPDLHRLYRNFAIAWVGTIVLMSVVFGGALYFLTRGQVKPDSEILQSQGNQAEEEKALQQSVEKAQKELAKRQTDFHQLMIQGGIALGNQRFEEALKDYQEALKLFPDNVDAAKASGECRSALEARNKAQAESDKRRAEFAQVMNQGKEAMKDRQFASAVRAFDNALRVMPGDVTAARAFRDAQAALEAEQVVKKKEADFDRHMTAGRADMVGQRYAEARDEFLAALQLKPEDPAAVNGRRLADRGLDELQNQEKRRAEFDRLMNQGAQALRNRRYEKAVRAYANAVNLFPKDHDARQGLRDAQTGLSTLKRDFYRLMEQGDLAMQTLRIGDAVRAYSQASKMFPDNEAAKSKLENAQQILADLGNSQAVYNRLMLQGATASRLGRFADATLFFGTALRVVPGDPDALLALQQSRAVLLGRPLGMFP